MWICGICGAESQDKYGLCQKCGNPKPKPPVIDQSFQGNSDSFTTIPFQTESHQYNQSNMAPPSNAYQSAAYSNVIPPNMPPQEYALLTRYTDAYRVARFIILVGNIVKGIGIIKALILLIIGLTSISGSGYRPGMELDKIIGVAEIVFGLIGGIVIFVIGILISALGQLQKATIDCAVNSSPFLANEQRARIMSLPLA